MFYTNEILFNPNPKNYVHPHYTIDECFQSLHRCMCKNKTSLEQKKRRILKYFHF